MSKYLTMVIVSAVFTAISQSVAPEKWQKYINAVTGVMIVSVIAAPVFQLKKIDLFSDYTYSSNIDEYAQKKSVCRELESRVSKDAAERLSMAIGGTFKVETKLAVNEEYEIVGVKEMTVWTKEKKEQVKSLLTEIYSPEKISFR